MVSVKTFIVERCERRNIKTFIEQWHYSHSINGIKSDYCFRLMNGDKLIGAMIFGGMAMANQYKRFSRYECDVTELRRLCCIDDTPKNTESFFIGKTLRWLHKYTQIKIVVSYADAEYGHQGTIYKASNFECLGKRPGARVIIWQGKRYHDKAIRAKYNGKLKPFAERLKVALETKEAFYANTAGKITYIYKLRSL